MHGESAYVPRCPTGAGEPIGVANAAGVRKTEFVLCGSDQAQSDDNRPMQPSPSRFLVQVELGKGRRIREEEDSEGQAARQTRAALGGAFIQRPWGSSLLHGQLAKARLHPPTDHDRSGGTFSHRRQPAPTPTPTTKLPAPLHDGAPRIEVQVASAGMRMGEDGKRRIARKYGNPVQQLSPQDPGLYLVPRYWLAPLPALLPRHPGLPGLANAG